MSDARVLHFFGGKGGVGKSTLAASYALDLADDAPKEKVLLVSLDPVRSLSDLVKKKLPAKPTRLVAGKGEGGLYAVELEPAALLKVFAARYVPALEKAAAKGSVLSEEDLGKLFSQAVPGLEELVSLFHVQELLESKEFDRVVIDTSPTSHTLRLFDLPLGLRKFLGIVKVSTDKAAAGSKGSKKEPLAAEVGFLEEVGGKVERLLGLLKDGTRSAFHLVALAEPVPEAQTRMYFAQLRERSIPVAEILVNQVEDRGGCPACQGRRGLQAPHVRKFQALDKGVSVQLVAKRELAPRGLDGLK
jgi:arsenite-transporting ATPase